MDELDAEISAGARKKDDLRQRIKELEATVDKDAVKKDQLAARIKELEASEKDKVESQKTARNLQVAIDALQVENKQLKAEQAGMEVELNELQKSRDHDANRGNFWFTAHQTIIGNVRNVLDMRTEAVKRLPDSRKKSSKDGGIGESIDNDVAKSKTAPK